MPAAIHAEFQPTLPAPKDKDDPGADTYKVIEIWDMRRPDLYYLPAGVAFGAFRDLYGGKPVLLYTILQRVEVLTKMRVVWAEGMASWAGYHAVCNPSRTAQESLIPRNSLASACAPVRVWSWNATARPRPPESEASP